MFFREEHIVFALASSWRKSLPEIYPLVDVLLNSSHIKLLSLTIYKDQLTKQCTEQCFGILELDLMAYIVAVSCGQYSMGWIACHSWIMNLHTPSMYQPTFVPTAIEYL